MVTLSLSPLHYASNPPVHTSINQNPCRSTLIPRPTATKTPHNRSKKKSRKFTVLAVTEGSRKSKKEEGKEKAEESVPSWANPDSDEPPPWARAESGSSGSQQSFQVPFIVYLLASAITAIAAIGSVFEYVNQKPVFGVLGSDSVFYAPVLGFFAFTGIPTAYGGCYTATWWASVALAVLVVLELIFVALRLEYLQLRVLVGGSLSMAVTYGLLKPLDNDERNQILINANHVLQV
ncbi:hypothetical protein C3L33_01785, partial [Rhododendron williamsianum]